MIRLQKRIISEELQAKITDRTARFLQLTLAGSAVPDHLAGQYKDSEVKDSLKLETHDKCAYCESKITHIDYGDVEHIIPKSVKPELRYSYDNLTLACGICNGRKGNFYDENNPLLNPYIDEPSDHFRACGPVVFRNPSSDRGLITEKRLDLNRGALVEKRHERLEAITSIMDQVCRAPNETFKNILLKQIEEECMPNKEYAFVIRSYVNATLGPS